LFVSPSLDENIAYLGGAFSGCGDIVSRKLSVGQDKQITIYITYADNMTNRSILEESVFVRLLTKPLKIGVFQKTDALGIIMEEAIGTAEAELSPDMDEIILAVLSGDTAIFADGCAQAIVLSTKGWPNRGVNATETEVVIQGSKEAFSETFRINTALIRRRIRDTRLKIKQMKSGTRSKTDIALVYLDDVVRPSILREVEEKIEGINIDAILDSGYIEQFIEGNTLSPFPQTQMTERPDKAAAAILEGRIVIVVDNSPFVLIVPATLNVFFQSAEDYYQRWTIMSFLRLLRYVGALLSVILPALYIAIDVYNPAMLPSLMVLKMAAARLMVPFPALFEVLIMQLAFELLGEADIRLPGPMGGAVGIVGGLIIGQAAVEAGIVSPIIVVVAALTGICSFTIPNISLVGGLRLARYFLIFCAAPFGLLGFWVGILILLIHLASLKSFGIPYLYPFCSPDVTDYDDLKDSIFRAPLPMMKRRPIFANRDCARRTDEEEGLHDLSK